MRVFNKEKEISTLREMFDISLINQIMDKNPAQSWYIGLRVDYMCGFFLSRQDLNVYTLIV